MPKDDFVEDFIIKKFELFEKLGKGAYGIVWRARKKSDNRIVALKKIFDAFQNKTDAQRTFREIQYLLHLNGHPNIVKLNNVILSKKHKDIYLVFDYVQSDLHNVIRAGMLKSQHIKYITYQILKGMKYIHSADIIHRDLKPSNILIDTDCSIKIADFGLARTDYFSDDYNKNKEKGFTDYIATRWYRAPEIVLGSSNYTKKADIWSLGCILGEMILQKPLFDGESSFNQLELFIKILGPIPDNILSDINCTIGTEIIKSITETNTRKNPTGIIKFLKIKDCYLIDFIEKIFNYNYKERPSVEELLNHEYLREFRDKKSEVNCASKMKLEVSDYEKLREKEYRNYLITYIKNNQIK